MCALTWPSTAQTTHATTDERRSSLSRRSSPPLLLLPRQQQQMAGRADAAGAQMPASASSGSEYSDDDDYGSTNSCATREEIRSVRRDATRSARDAAALIIRHRICSAPAARDALLPGRFGMTSATMRRATRSLTCVSLAASLDLLSRLLFSLDSLVLLAQRCVDCNHNDAREGRGGKK